MNRELLLAGASNQIAAFLIPRLLKADWQVTAISRKLQPAWVSPAAGLSWRQLDLASEPLPVFKAGVLVHLAPLHLFKPLLAVMPALQRVIACSSTSRFSKSRSTDDAERLTARQLASGEQCLVDYCQDLDLPWTLLRPTLIYGAGLDQSLTRLAGLIRKWRFLALPGKAQGRRQPVHADDLAAAIENLLAGSAGCNRSYQLTGGETLEYREMVTGIFRSLQLKPRIVHLPRLFLRPAMALLRLHPRYRDVNLAMLDRINEDLVFDSSQAAEDFGYQARGFAPRREDWEQIRPARASDGPRSD